eukprot:3542170-Pleurochrysis_carterae.AAC.3
MPPPPPMRAALVQHGADSLLEVPWPMFVCAGSRMQAKHAETVPPCYSDVKSNKSSQGTNIRRPEAVSLPTSRRRTSAQSTWTAVDAARCVTRQVEHEHSSTCPFTAVSQHARAHPIA